MIIRMWHGRVHHDNAAAYREFLIDRAIPDYQSVKGNINVRILERHEDDGFLLEFEPTVVHYEVVN